MMISALVGVFTCISVAFNVLQYSQGPQAFSHAHGLASRLSLSAAPLGASITACAKNLRRKLSGSARTRTRTRTRTPRRTLAQPASPPASLASPIFDSVLPPLPSYLNLSSRGVCPAPFTFVKSMPQTTALVPMQTTALVPMQTTALVPYQTTCLVPYQAITLVPIQTIPLLATTTVPTYNNSLTQAYTLSLATISSLSTFTLLIDSGICVADWTSSFEATFVSSLLLGFLLVAGLLAWLSPDPRTNWRLVVVTGALDINVEPTNEATPVLGDCELVLDEALTALIEESLSRPTPTPCENPDEPLIVVPVFVSDDDMALSTDDTTLSTDDATLADTSSVDVSDVTLVEETSASVEEDMDLQSWLTSSGEPFFAPKKTSKYMAQPPSKPSISGPTFFDRKLLADGSSSEGKKKKRSKKLKDKAGT